MDITNQPPSELTSRQLPHSRGMQISQRISFLKGIKLKHVPLPAALFLLTMLFPPQFYLYVGSLRITVLRAFLLLVTVPVLIKIIKRKQLKSFDVLFISFALWTMAALCINHGYAYGLESGGMRLIETLLPFLIARIYVKKPEQMLALLKLIVVIVTLLLLPAMVESVTHNPFIQKFASLITGHGRDNVKVIRLGMMRATTVFAHPILYGLFCVSIFAVVIFSERNFRHKLIWGSVIFVAAFFSLSSGPLLGLITTLFLLIWEYLTRKIQARLTISMVAAVIIYILALSFNSSPLFYFISRLTLNPATAYYRKIIWEYGSNNVVANPWFGIGFHDWVRPSWMVSDSVDNFWLRIAMVGGIPTAIFLVLGILILLLSVDKYKTRTNPNLYYLRMGWVFSVLSLCMIGATVDMFGTNLPYFFFFLGLGVCLTRRYGSELHKVS